MARIRLERDNNKGGTSYWDASTAGDAVVVEWGEGGRRKGGKSYPAKGTQLAELIRLADDKQKRGSSSGHAYKRVVENLTPPSDPEATAVASPTAQLGYLLEIPADAADVRERALGYAAALRLDVTQLDGPRHAYAISAYDDVRLLIPNPAHAGGGNVPVKNMKGAPVATLALLALAAALARDFDLPFVMQSKPNQAPSARMPAGTLAELRQHLDPTTIPLLERIGVLEAPFKLHSVLGDTIALGF